MSVATLDVPWGLFWIPLAGYIVRTVKGSSVHKDKVIFLLLWVFSVYLYTQPAVSKLASYIFPLFPAVAILLAHYLHEKLSAVEKGESPLALKLCGFAMFVILVAVIIGGIIAGNHYIDVIVSLKPVFITAVLAGFIAGGLLFFNLKGQYARMVFGYVGISITLLVMLFFAQPYIEPWVSCKDIIDRFKKIDSSDTPILASKFYVRGVRYYTDRPTAVIDIGGTGFWSPHPIPFLNQDGQVIEFFNQRPVSYAVLKEGNVEDVKRILKGQPFKIEELDGIGGKYILRVTKL
jgi:4-amino-4-deoxy-L-arabinose transferase-like glycosyltransferase